MMNRALDWLEPRQVPFDTDRYTASFLLNIRSCGKFRYTQVHSTVIVEDLLFKNKISNNSQIERDFD